MNSRRLFLRASCGAILASPLLKPSLSKAQETAAKRVITVFFGQGLPEEWYPTQTAGALPRYRGAMAPWNDFADRFLIAPADHINSTASSTDPHDVGPQTAFTGRGLGRNAPAGPTIDQVALESIYSNGVPTQLQTVSMGTFHREGGLVRHVHSWKKSLTPAALPIEDPSVLFDRLFGNQMTREAPLEQRKRRSVLDSVIETYQHYQGANSPLAAEQKAQISDHLDRLRQMEKRAFTNPSTCNSPQSPEDTGAKSLKQNQRLGGGGGGTDVVADEWAKTWQLLVDLYVTGLECDLFRFGNITFQSGGDRIRLFGDYKENGQIIESFDDKETSHEYFHAWNSGGNNLAQSHMRFIMGNLAYLFSALDKAKDEKNESLLDSLALLVTTELSDPGRHSYRRVFHAINSNNGTFKTGARIDTDGASNLDLYNTCLQGMNVPSKMGGENYRPETVNGVLA